jgi:hypothetical protein
MTDPTMQKISENLQWIQSQGGFVTHRECQELILQAIETVGNMVNPQLLELENRIYNLEQELGEIRRGE